MLNSYFNEIEKAQVIFNLSSETNADSLMDAFFENIPFLESAGVQRLQINSDNFVDAGIIPVIEKILKGTKISITAKTDISALKTNNSVFGYNNSMYRNFKPVVRAAFMEPAKTGAIPRPIGLRRYIGVPSGNRVPTDKSGRPVSSNLRFSICININLNNEMEDFSIKDQLELFSESIKGLFVELSFSRKHMNCLQEKAARLINHGVNNIIFSPVSGVRKARKDKDCLAMNEFSDLLQILKSAKENNNTAMYFRRGILPRAFILEHPCNAYVCSGRQCHGRKSGLPRNLFINHKGDVFPETDCMHHSLKMGNIHNKSIESMLSGYKESLAYSNFMSLCQCVFEEFIMNSPYPIIPLVDLLIMKSQELK